MGKSVSKRSPALLGAAFIYVACSSHAVAQQSDCSLLAPAFPQRPLTLVVPFPAGAQTDLIGRLVAEELAQRLKQAVVVENKAGAGGNIGAASVARAEPSGHTILLATISTHAISPSFYKNLSFDHFKDFKPVAYLVDAPQVILARKALGASTLHELAQLAKDKPGSLNLALPGTGTLPHLAGELFKIAANIKIANVMYRGGAPAMTDLIGGQVDLYIDAIMTAIPQVESGAVKALAITGKSRSKLLPNVPAANETFADYDVSAWWGIAAPARTPIEVIDRLNCDINTILSDSRVSQRLAAMGATPRTMSPTEFSHFIGRETEKYREIVKSVGIQQE
ncbi:Bug family tripartite tricarboxylate transporter substrate binding protein [Bosea sp. NPDC055332]